MKFTIRNQANIANKYIRFAKWKILQLNKKLNELIYSEIYLKKISHTPEVFEVTVKLGVPGPDIVVSAKSQNINELWSELSSKIKRQLRKYNERKIAFS